ncbi:MAG: hydroxymethylglutaryl-CoA reductase, degradative [Deltaproteobacteria bacterium]|nr:hydroxymethylglutaryl-CoA reductase, degradative [Deltaproteobacteria bacterium]
MAESFSSRLPGFNKLAFEERLSLIASLCRLSPEEAVALYSHADLPVEIASQMIENAIGVLGLPLGLGLNFRINGRDYLVPMAVEEPSVIAAVSLAAKIVREAGGFTAKADDALMAAQIQVMDYGDPLRAAEALRSHKDELLTLANSFHPAMQRRGGGARDVEVRLLDAPEGPQAEPILVLHLLIDTRDAMGANLINTVAEGVAPMVEDLTGGKVLLRILSNLCDRRLASASCRIPVEALADFGMTGAEVARGIWQASRFALADPYRAATHNKGVMNGVDAVAIATGNDWRAIEAGAHAFASRSGRYGPLSTWVVEGQELIGRIELPLAVGTVGGPIKVHPHVRLMHRLLGAKSARELAQVMAAVGLAQNLAALRALGTVGIQKGHLALHARCVAVEAGARPEQVERLADLLVRGGLIKVEKARELLRAMPPPSATGTTG